MTTARCFFALALFLSFSVHADYYKVFLLGGQSNMVGTGADTSGLPTNLQSPQDDVLFYYGSSLTTLRPGSGQSFGPEVTFGRTIADADPSENFCLIKYAVSGSDLTSAWDPATGSVYSNFRTKVADGLAALTAAGHTYEIVGMLWTQGERDARIGRTTAQYEFDLNEFITDLRSRYGANLRFFLNRLSANQTDIPDITRVRAAQENVTSSDPLAYLINADAMTFHDDLHFDAAGQIDLGEAFGQAYINAITPDVTAPEISTLTPANGASPVDPWTNLNVEFDEEVIFGTGKIYLRQTGGALVEEFDVASPPANLTLSVSSITIDPTNILAGSTGHYIEIDASAIDDLSGNSFAGITGDATWSFTTAASDLSPPSILSLSPTHLEAEVDSRIDLAITFTENITLGTGTITLQQSGGALVESFDVANPPANLSLSGATITLNPSSDLSASTSYYVEIASTAIKDFSGNSFAGISGEATWSFTVSDAVAIEGSGITAAASSIFNPSATQPSKTIDGSGLTEDQHANGTQKGWYSEDTINIADQWIQWDLGDTYVIDSIQVWNWNQDSRINGSIQQVDIYVSSLESPGDPEGAGAGNWTLWAENATFNIATGQNDYTGFDLETALGATLPTGQIRWVRFEIDSNFETAGSANENLVGLSEIRFVGSVSTGPDTTPPSINTLSPAHTATNVTPSSNLSITFTENIAFDTGKIYLSQTGGALVEEFDVANPPAGLTLLGASVTLNPTADLVASTGYYLEIDDTAIDDLAGNSFAGFSGNGTWSFTTAADSPPPQGGGFIDASGITVTASEFNTGGAGFPAIRTIDDSGLSEGVHAITVGTSWLTPNNSPAEDWIEWDLGASYTLGSIQVWNVNNNGNNTFGTKSVDIYFSNVATPGDPEGAGAVNWTKLGGASLTLPQAPASNNTGFDLATATSTALPTTAVRFVRFELNTNWAEANTYTGIAEIQFFANPTSGGDTFASWIDGFGLDPADKDLGDDPDGDGQANGIENYFGTHPGEFSQGLVSGTVTGNEMTFTHPLNGTPASNLTAAYRWSKDLSSFHGDGIQFEGTTVSFEQDPPADGMVSVIATITGTALDKLFVDIQVAED